MDKIKIGFAPTRRSIFSAPDAVKYRKLTAERLTELGIDFVDITDINGEGLLYDEEDRLKIAEKFNIQLAPIPMPELTDAIRKAKEEETEVADTVKYCREKMEIMVDDAALENVAALKVAMKRLVLQYGCQAAAIQCWNQLQSEIGIMPCAAN